IAVILAIFGVGNLEAHSGKTTAVMSELADYHAVLLTNPDAAIDTSRLVVLLEAGGDSAKITAIFASAVAPARNLGQATTSTARLAAYAALVDGLREVVGHHDESGARVFYCPMAKKYWIARGETVQNPYLSNMRSCGTVKQSFAGSRAGDGDKP
ncbi:MAG: hypothetical protein RIF32_06335, partial [Leptospirales bacterium]